MSKFEFQTFIAIHVTLKPALTKCLTGAFLFNSQLNLTAIRFQSLKFKEFNDMSVHYYGCTAILNRKFYTLKKVYYCFKDCDLHKDYVYAA